MCAVFAPSLSYPTVLFFHKKLLPAIVISSHIEEKQPMYRFKSLKKKKKNKKNTFFVREWLGQKGLEKLCEIFES